MKLIQKISILFFIILSIGAVGFFVLKPKPCEGYSCLNFPNKETWKVQEIYQNTDDYWYGLITEDNYDIRLQNFSSVSPEEADSFTNIAIMKINGLFDTAKSPYAGEISDKIVCPDSLKPEEGEMISDLEVPIHYFASYLNDRLQYGACTESQITHSVFAGIFYCANTSQWYQVELISPLSEKRQLSFYKDLFKGVGCISDRW